MNYYKDVGHKIQKIRGRQLVSHRVVKKTWKYTLRALPQALICRIIRDLQWRTTVESLNALQMNTSGAWNTRGNSFWSSIMPPPGSKTNKSLAFIGSPVKWELPFTLCPSKTKKQNGFIRLNETNRFNWTGGVKISLGRHGSGLMVLPRIMRYYSRNMLWWSKFIPATFSRCRTAAFSPRMSKSSVRSRIIFTGTAKIHSAGNGV